MTILFPYMARWNAIHASRYYQILTKVAELGHKIFVIQPPSRGSLEANDIDAQLKTHPNIELITIHINKRFWSFNFPFEKLIKKFVYTLYSIKYVSKIIKRENVDFIYLYNIPQFIYLFGKHPKIIFDFADDLLGMLEVELSISPKHFLYRLANSLLNWIVKKSEIVICISSPLFNKVNHRNKYIIPNGTDISINVDRLTSKNEKNKNKITVGYVGAFEYSMDLDSIIEAAKILQDVHFLLVGTGRDFPRIEKKSKDYSLHNVTLTGGLPHNEAMELILTMDICLNIFNKSKVSDAVSPIKLFEYLAHQKPVISTSLEEVNRIDDDFLYYADNVEEIVKQINYITNNWQEAQNKAKKGYEIVKNKFSWTIIAKDFSDAVHNIYSTQNPSFEKNQSDKIYKIK